MELLVHIAAPSSRKDDDRYTLQARNYLAYIAGLREGNDDAATETVDEVTEAVIDTDRSERDDDSTQTQFRSFDNHGQNDIINPNDVSSKNDDSTEHVTLLQARAPSFPFPNSAESNPTPSVENNVLYSFTSVSSAFTSASSVLRLQNKRRKCSFNEIASEATSESATIPSQRRRLSHSSSLAPKTPSFLTQDDYMNGDTTDIALAIAEVEEQKAAEQAKLVQKKESIEAGGEDYGKVQSLQYASQRTESLLDSSPCDGRETGSEMIQSEKGSVEKGILLATPDLPRYLPAPIAQNKSADRGSTPSDIAPVEKKSQALAEKFFSASSYIFHSPESAYEPPKLPPKPNSFSPTKLGSQCRSLPLPEDPVSQRPLSSLPLIHTPARPPKASSIRTSDNKNDTYVTSALEYLISIPPLLKNYHCPVKSSPSSSISSWKKKSKRSNTTRRHQTRPIRSSERGYWSLDPSPWPPALQFEFWTYLGRIIRLGRAGWEVWCVRAAKSVNGHHRDDRHHESCSFMSSTDVSTDIDSSHPCSSSSLGPIKVFCWGEIVPHLYLLLFVASRRALRTVEASWIDAKKEVVVRIGPS